MGTEGVSKVTARLAAITVLALATVFGLAATATAKPVDRGDDPVVLKGAQLNSLLGAAPGSIAGFAWRKGDWIPVPVQVDERHTLDVRSLYPEGNNPQYVGANNPAFDLEIYSDVKTRAGADPGPAFDADDELVFMGADTGGKAPQGAGAPAGMEPVSGVRVKVKDPAGGGQSFLYLFQSRGEVDQSAGRDYVEYDFKLANLAEGQTLKDDYGYFHATNLEDSTVTTSRYRLHSWDRWMEDEMQVKAGNATGVDILDREVAQATKFACGRSEFTFSGRWLEDTYPGNDTDTDDEGTYVTVIDGPVRAIRSYMGANSGPYVQREHIYYRSHERNTVYLRVHVMPDLLTWTDYSEAAIGMTYRDVANPAGVTVDGVPDTVQPTGTAQVAGGAFAWQQLAGEQGTVTTLVGADTDIPNPKFGNYYLDEVNPEALDELQCGGDGKSIGASGFGIFGTVPNTDPRTSPFNNLTVKRVRYFDAPGGGAALGARYANRAQKPLTGSSARAGTKAPKLRWKTKFANRGAKARPGKVARIKLKLTNSGTVTMSRVKVCVVSNGFAGRKVCGKVATVGIGKARTATLKVRVKPGVKGRTVRFRASVTARGGGYVAQAGAGNFRLRLAR